MSLPASPCPPIIRCWRSRTSCSCRMWLGSPPRRSIAVWRSRWRTCDASEKGGHCSTGWPDRVVRLHAFTDPSEPSARQSLRRHMLDRDLAALLKIDNVEVEDLLARGVIADIPQARIRKGQQFLLHPLNIVDAAGPLHRFDQHIDVVVAG